jgi:hypothetical protein
MRHQISISEETFRRLKSLAEPFIDREPEDVIRRLLDQLGNQFKPDPNDARTSTRAKSHPAQSLNTRERSPDSRAPRERGVRVQIGNHTIEAISVRDLYEQALRLFVERYKPELQAVVPFRTSSERYLIAREPIHPSGNPFVVPVSIRDFHIEAHKDYKNAIQHLRLLSERLGVNLSYLG